MPLYSLSTACAPISIAGARVTMTSAAASPLAKLRINLLEIAAVDEHLARLATGPGRHQSLGFHHVHQPGRAAEPDPHLPLEVRDRHLAARHHDACRLVVQVVFLVLD